MHHEPIKDIIITDLQSKKIKFRNLKSEWKNDKDIAIIAIKIQPRDLEYASDELKNNKEVVMAAVFRNGYTLEYASNELKNDYEVVFTALDKFKNCFEHASDELKNNKTLLEKYLQIPTQDVSEPQFYEKCKFKLNLLKEQEFMENNIPINTIVIKPKKF